MASEGERLAAIHAAAFRGAARWSAAALARASADPLCFLLRAGRGGEAAGFALGRAVAGEAELLTLAVAPAHRRAGLGRDLLRRFEAQARGRGAAEAFLEVAADNRAAIALYEGAGWTPVGRRSGYYDGTDAIAFGKPLDAASPAPPGPAAP